MPESSSRGTQAERRVRLAMVGAGRHAGAVHYPSLASFEDVEMAAVCDLDIERAKAAADRFGIEKRYTDYRRMVEETSPDAVYAIGPPHIMYDIWTWCLRQGLNLFIEKPMGLTIHQARALAYLAEEHGCVTQVGFQRRSSPLFVRLREKCLERGPIVHAVCQFYKCMTDPCLEAFGHITGDGVHAIDTLRWMCGGEVVEVRSLARRVGVPDVNFAVAILRFDNGSTGVLLNSWSSGRRTFRIEMHAPGICAEADEEKGSTYADGDTRGVKYDAREIAGGEEFHVYGGFRAKNREFIDCVRSGGRPSSSFADAAETMSVAEQILAKALLEGP